MEKLTWFKFTISDWMMGKIMKCPEVTQARFIRLCCLYWNKECVLTIDDAEIEIDEDHLKALLGKKVVSTDGDSIQIKFLDEQWADILETSDKRRDAVNKRWEKVNKKNTSVSKSDTSVSNNHTSVLQNDTEKRESRVEGKENKNLIKVNNIDLRKKEFSATLSPFLEFYGKDLLNEFYAYWTEPNKSNTKFKKELERTWDLTRRLNTWAKNDKNFHRTGSQSKMEKLKEAYNTPNPYKNGN